MKEPAVEIYDTTLRDGAQGEGLAYSVDDKIKIAQALDEIGVAFIEGGWPGANPKDVEFFERAKSLRLNAAALAAFGSTRRANTVAADDAVVQG
jgi:2-isopropylmalate synthase